MIAKKTSAEVRVRAIKQAQKAAFEKELFAAESQLKIALEIRDVRTWTSKQKWPLEGFHPDSFSMARSVLNLGNDGIIRAAFHAWGDITGPDACRWPEYTPFWARPQKPWWATRSCDTLHWNEDRFVKAALGYNRLAGEVAQVFVTNTGHIGIATQNFQRGDRLVLLSGAKLPVILRPANGTFSFRGLAFVQGLSQECVDEKILFEEFVLC